MKGILFAIGVIVLLVVIGNITGGMNESARLAREAKEKNQAAEYYRQHKAEVLQSIQSRIDAGQYAHAVTEANKYIRAFDEDLERLKLAAQEQFIVQKLKSIPAARVEENRDLYAELVRINPGEPRYQRKLDYYQAKLDAAAKVHEDRVKKFGNPPVASAWDGSYPAVERYLERVMNDPESLDMEGCTKVFYTADGWLVGCTYRGRNAFGGMIKTANWFTIRSGAVVKIHAASAYSWSR